MAVMMGSRTYKNVRLPCTQPLCSKRTQTGTWAGRTPPGTVQVMLLSERLGEQELCEVPPPRSLPSTQLQRPSTWPRGSNLLAMPVP